MKNKRHRNNSKNIVILILGIAVLVAVILCIVLFAVNRPKVFHLMGGTTTYYVNDEQYELKHEPFISRGAAYIPAEDILTRCEYALSWDAANGVLHISKEDIEAALYKNSNVVTYNGNAISFDVSTVMYEDILFMPLVMFKQLSIDELFIDGSIAEVWIPERDLMEDTYIDDTYRYADKTKNYNGVYVVDNTVAMEKLAYPDENCTNYAAVINTIAESLPEVQIYNIVIPSMAEFYGPESLYTDQISGIRNIYQQLSESVMPINATKELWAHADEQLYFGTDHHWTQRGAYYAYKAFLENRGEEVPALESFPTDNVEDFTGSWLRSVKGTSGENALRANSETLERFLPVVEYSGDIYNDMMLTSRVSSSKAINLNDDTYTTFIYGDQPITRYVTDVNNGKKVVLVKESYGNAFAPWLLNSYEEVYIIDPRYWNGFGGKATGEFKLQTFYSDVCQFDDLIVLSYPGSASPSMRQAIMGLVQ